MMLSMIHHNEGNFKINNCNDDQKKNLHKDWHIKHYDCSNDIGEHGNGDK